MVVGGGPAKVFLDPAAHSLSIPSMGLTVDLGDIRELVPRELGLHGQSGLWKVVFLA